MNCDYTRNLLNGYVDGELDLANHLQIEQHLTVCHECSLEYNNLAELKSAMADEVFYLRASPKLHDRLRTSISGIAPQPPTPPFWKWRWMPELVTSFAVIALLLSSMLFFRTLAPTDDLLAQEIVSAHIRSMMADHLTDVNSTDQHTVKPWFDGKLDFSPPVIDMGSNGFTLIGGRLDYAGSRPVAALVYQRRQHLVNLFIFPSPDNSESGSKMSVRQGYNLIHWNRSGMTFWAASDLNLGELQEFSQTLQN